MKTDEKTALYTGYITTHFGKIHGSTQIIVSTVNTTAGII